MPHSQGNDLSDQARTRAGFAQAVMGEQTVGRPLDRLRLLVWEQRTLSGGTAQGLLLLGGDLLHPQSLGQKGREPAEVRDRRLPGRAVAQTQASVELANPQNI